MTKVDQYNYELPRELIAQSPLPNRVDARLMVVDRQRQSISHHYVRDLAEFLRPGDCLVLNDTRVIPARLVGFRTQTHGRWEGLFLEADAHGLWRVLCKTRGKLTEGESIQLVNAQGAEDICLTTVARQSDGSWVVKPESPLETFALLEQVGRVPLPPYIRKGEMLPDDRQNYQTVFARNPGAVAAPTAGLHFTQHLLDQIQARGVLLCWVTLHVGQGTFRPIETDEIEEHPMHAEWGHVSPETVATLTNCRAQGGRIVAVGTTAVRLLETAAAEGTLRPYTGLTGLFIRPPYQFKAVDVMMTNFHLPRTTLLVLVRTFGGDELIRRAYEEAIAEEYRFYSYGDAMLIL
jgi:S-adenosylmethionine:tRNA ribosyltransferase-isomerase